MKIKTLHDALVHDLQDLYSAEVQLTKALPKMAKASSHQELTAAFQDHLEQTKGHVERLEKALKQLEASTRGEKCKAMEGLLEEGKETVDEDAEPHVKDAALIAAAQRVEHYEITAYGSLMAWAKLLGYQDALKLLKANEQEEKAADAKLSKLAESTVNQQAASAGADAEDDQQTSSRSKGMA